MRASIEAQHSWILKDLERQTQARAGESARLLKELEDWKAECMRLRGDCGGEQRAKVELEQRHAAVITELESLREKLREQDAAECRRFVDEIQGRSNEIFPCPPPFPWVVPKPCHLGKSRRLRARWRVRRACELHHCEGEEGIRYRLPRAGCVVFWVPL